MKNMIINLLMRTLVPAIAGAAGAALYTYSPEAFAQFCAAGV